MKRVLMCLLTLLFILPAYAQTDETLKHAATMEAIGKMADAMKAQAEAMGRMADRVTGGAVQPVAQIPKEVECQGFMNCTVAGFKGLFGAVKDVAGIGASVATPLYAYKTAIRQYDYQKVAAEQQTAQVQAQQGTLQYAFGAQKDVAVAGFNQPNPPTTNISGNTGPVLVGGGNLYSGSMNPVNPNPLVKVCSTSPTGVTTCQ